ncbi:hypothetical protein cand_036850 [Cryptosporidium andersoni]|uniref:DUF155 domain-containing protein n=1 Tax=Cryptosporidium andersoni TaxID=117008 RepID=A0A1J4MYN6_9CRYT|nr:hypothetical protein cand_036850 [Cryptosporidium andersoni]
MYKKFDFRPEVLQTNGNKVPSRRIPRQYSNRGLQYRTERRFGRSIRNRSSKVWPKFGKFDLESLENTNYWITEGEYIYKFQVVRGFCPCEHYDLESLYSALQRHNYFCWYADKEKQILVFNLTPYLDKLEITWKLQGRSGHVLFPAGIYKSSQCGYNEIITGDTKPNRILCDVNELVNTLNKCTTFGTISNIPIIPSNIKYKQSEVRDTVFHDSHLPRYKDPCNLHKNSFSIGIDELCGDIDQSKYMKSRNINTSCSRNFSEKESDYSEHEENLYPDQDYWKSLENPIFVFANGVVITWSNEQSIFSGGMHLPIPPNTDERLDDILAFLLIYAQGIFTKNSVKKYQSTSMLYICNYPNRSPTHPPSNCVISDIIKLKTRSAYEKLAVSLAIAQSIRLSIFENCIDDCVVNIRHLPLKLAQVGASTIIEEELKVEAPTIRKRFSELYSYQIAVNLVEDFLDIPDIFWHNCRFHNVWKYLHDYLEIPARLEVLNRRIVCMQELLRVITEERQTAQANRITWIVITLLALHCIAFALRHLFFHRD